MILTQKIPVDLNERIARYLAQCPPAVSGQGGHDQTFFVACQLTNGFGLGESDALYYLKLYSEKCQPPWSDNELMHKIKSSLTASHDKPHGHLLNGDLKPADFVMTLPKPPGEKPIEKTKSPIDECTSYLGGYRLAEADLDGKSPVTLPGPERETLVFIANLYQQGDKINIVTKYTTSQDGKASPSGMGDIIERDELLERLSGDQSMHSDAGAWIRMNPLDGHGVADANVTDYRFILLESDSVPNDLWISLIFKLGLPVAAVIDSGGKSAHCWIKVDCMDATEYRDTFEMLLKHLERFGLDRKNRNPGRLSRLPGVDRHIPEKGRRQKLLYLNPAPASLNLEKLAEQLKLESGEEQRIRVLFEGRLYKQGEDSTSPTPIFSLMGTPCCTKGNITAIFAAEGVGKSAVMSAMMSAAIKPLESDADCLGWTAEPLGEKCIIHMDTEQSKEHRAKSMQRTARRVGLNDVPKSLISVRAHGLGWVDCQKLLQFTLKYAIKEYPAGIHSIFIDGPGDIVPSVNDEEKSNETVANLMMMAEEYGTNVISVIHLNHGTMNESKMRGHMGSQLARKAETTLKVAIKDDVRCLYAPKTREKPIPEKNGARFAWDEQKSMFVLINPTDMPSKEEEKRSELLNYAQQAFIEAEKTALGWKEFVDVLATLPGINSRKTAEKKHQAMKSAGVIVQNLIGKWELA